MHQGDTLFSIAWLNGFDYRTLASINHIQPPYDIYPGQRLYLKGHPENASASRKDSVKNHSGQTSKLKTNQSVDHQKKQAYGNHERSINNQPGNSNDNDIHWVWPTQGKIIERFSIAEQGNKGIDITNRINTPVVAAADGKVVYSGNALRGYGWLIIIKHSDNYLTAYAHNSKVLVHEQQHVEAGEKIALMGKSDSSRIKLHFEIRFRGRSVDPLRFLPKENNNK